MDKQQQIPSQYITLGKLWVTSVGTTTKPLSPSSHFIMLHKLHVCKKHPTVNQFISFCSTSPQDGSTPLWYASQNGHSIIVDLLLSHGADPNTANNVRYSAILLFQTPLHMFETLWQLIHYQCFLQYVREGSDGNKRLCTPSLTFWVPYACALSFTARCLHVRVTCLH